MSKILGHSSCQTLESCLLEVSNRVVTVQFMGLTGITLKLYAITLVETEEARKIYPFLKKMSVIINFTYKNLRMKMYFLKR